MKRLDRLTHIITGALLILILAGCAPQAATPSPGDIQTALAQTLTAEPSPTLSPTPRSTSTPASSPTPAHTQTPTSSPPISGTISAAFLNLRAGPSTFFDIIQTFVEGTPITALTRTADSKWVKVEIEFEDNPTMEGWMAVIFLDLKGDVEGLPVEAIGAERIIQGKVADTDDHPVPGINVAVILHNDQVDLRSDATSGEDGIFTVYLPEDLSGTFDVQIVSWNCESPIADANCQLSGYIQVDDRIFMTVPAEQPEEILFTYQATTQVLTGKVVDAKGNPADRVLVVAERDDGATSIGRSDALGDFSIPIAAGTWEVYTVTYEPDYTEGDHVPVEISDSAPEAITVEAPSP